MVVMTRHSVYAASLLLILLPSISTAQALSSGPTPSRVPATARTELVIAAVGDVMMPGSIQKAVSKHEKNYDILFEKIVADLADADITFANLETPVDHTAAAAGYPAFNARPELLSALKKAGIDIVSLANNHALDAGADGLLRTLQNTEAAGIVVVGAGRTRGESPAPAYLSSQGVITAFLAYTYGTNRGLPKKRKSPPAVNILRPGSREDLNAAIIQVKQARSHADLVAVSLHWGDEYASVPTPWQKQAAIELVEAGADIILGHHPHVLQPIESYTTKDGRNTVIAYSLGNFTSSQNYGVSFKNKTHARALRGDGVILTIYAEKEQGKTTIVRSAVQPIWSLREKVGATTVFRPVCLSREIEKLSAITKRTKKEESSLQLLTYRQKVIRDTTSATSAP
jgi:poly-gamma-glutamate capsule biosynthesis protein CapA/YwtB (metallophosphatase superfamily)